MKGKKKLFLLLLIILIIIIIAVIVIFTFKPKQKADILDTVSSADTQPKPVPSTTQPATAVPPTTQPASIFQGSVAGDWSGQVADDPPFDIAGTFSVAIDAKGDVNGSFEGSYSGTIKGQVDLKGNLSAKGTASVGEVTYVITWNGKLSVSVNSLSTQSDLSAPFISGKFSGKGATSK